MRLTLTMTNIFIISDRTAFRGTFRIQAKCLRWSFILEDSSLNEQLKTSGCETFSRKVASWMLDCVHTAREKTTQIQFSAIDL